jgi:hypothetical protein
MSGSMRPTNWQPAVNDWDLPQTKPHPVFGRTWPNWKPGDRVSIPVLKGGYTAYTSPGQ